MDAILYLATPGDTRAALELVAGRPVAFRALVTAVRAGCRRVGVPAIFHGTAVERAIAANPAARAAALWLGPGAQPPAGAVLLVPAAALLPFPALLRMRQSTARTILVESRDSETPVVLADGGLARALWSQLVAGEPLAGALATALAGASLGTLAAGSWFVRITTAAEARRAEDLLYGGLGSAIDTQLDRALHRRLSRPLSRTAVSLGITPNQVSIVSLFVGIGAAWCIWQATAPGALAGLLLYAASVVLDHVDGEVARLTLAESKLGEWLDVLIDTLVHALIVVAMGAATVRAVGGGGEFIGALAAVGVFASAALAKTSPQPLPGDHFGAALASVGTRDGFYVSLVLFGVAVAVLPGALPPLMVLVALGAHLYWLGHAAHRLGRRRAAASARPSPRSGLFG